MIPGGNGSLLQSNQSAWYKIKSSVGPDQYIPRIIDITAENLRQYSSKWTCKKCLLVILLILLILAVVITAILLSIFLRHRNSITANASANFTTIGTTSINCVFPYVLAPSGTCVNILIDSNNCGAVGNICAATYSCSAGVCSTAPGVQLDKAIAIWSSAINGSADDEMYSVTLPWNITLYNTTKNRATVTTNGVLCLGGCATTYTDTILPANMFSGATAFPYWDDLYIYANTSQGIYYGSEGNVSNRTLTFEYYMSHYIEPNQYYHFQVVFFEAAPGVVQYKYFDDSDGGITCTVGVQASNTGPFIQYSYGQVNSVQPNMTLTFNTNLGTYTNSTMG